MSGDPTSHYIAATERMRQRAEAAEDEATVALEAAEAAGAAVGAMALKMGELLVENRRLRRLMAERGIDGNGET